MEEKDTVKTIKKNSGEREKEVNESKEVDKNYEESYREEDESEDGFGLTEEE